MFRLPYSQLNREPTDQFEAMYAKTFEEVFRYLLRRTDSQADAEDLVADVFTTAWKKLRSIPADQELPWLYKTAHNHLLNYWRKQAKKTKLVKNIDDFEPTTRSTEESSLLELADELAQLKPAEAEVIRLSCWEGLDTKDLAAALGCSENAVYIRLHRAKENLQNRLEKPAQEISSIMKETSPSKHLVDGDENEMEGSKQ